MKGGFDPILFELDGTVIDPVQLIRESHPYAVDPAQEALLEHGPVEGQGEVAVVVGNQHVADDLFFRDLRHRQVDPDKARCVERLADVGRRGTGSQVGGHRAEDVAAMEGVAGGLEAHRRIRDLDRLVNPAQPVGGNHQQPVVGTDQVVVTRPQGQRPAVASDARVDHRDGVTGGERAVDGAGSMVAELIDQLETNHAGIKERLVENDEVRRFVNIYVNDEDIRFTGGLGTPVTDGNTVVILPAVAGGAAA